MSVYHSQSEDKTKALGLQLAQTLPGGCIVTLHGELGAGKTTFVKGLAEGLGVEDEILSPTFTLMNVYKPQTPNPKLQTLIHIDTYRLKNEQELIDIGVTDYLGDTGTICVIEWPEKIKRLLKRKRIINVTLSTKTKKQRKIEIHAMTMNNN